VKYKIRCSICGRYCFPFDSGVPYGKCTDSEPPAEEIFCKDCSIKEYFNNLQITNCWYIKPNFIRSPEEILSLEKNWDFSNNYGTYSTESSAPLSLELLKESIRLIEEKIDKTLINEITFNYCILSYLELKIWKDKLHEIIVEL
jgi:hypothetical protein